ncbi:MAG: glycoside hydrolase domain-containing protein [Hymenobacter sp.]
MPPAVAEWNELLGRVEVAGGSEAHKETFYTNLYRAYTGRAITSDVNGQYTDACEKTQQLAAPADAVYSSDSFWGTQWNLTAADDPGHARQGHTLD